MVVREWGAVLFFLVSGLRALPAFIHVTLTVYLFTEDRAHFLKLY